MSDRDLDRLAYEPLEGDTDRRHGEHILAAVDDAREGRQRGEDSLLELLRKAHQATAPDKE